MTTSQTLTLSLHGETFKLTDTNDYSIFLPADVNGLRLLKSLLRAKNSNPLGKIGTNSKPTQAMVEAFLRNLSLEKENAKERDLEELSELF